LIRAAATARRDAAARADVEDVAVAGEVPATHHTGEQLGVGLGPVDAGGIQHHVGRCALTQPGQTWFVMRP
jgi:hypothetical protein